MGSPRRLDPFFQTDSCEILETPFHRFGRNSGHARKGAGASPLLEFKRVSPPAAGKALAKATGTQPRRNQGATARPLTVTPGRKQGWSWKIPQCQPHPGNMKLRGSTPNNEPRGAHAPSRAVPGAPAGNPRNRPDQDPHAIPHPRSNRRAARARPGTRTRSPDTTLLRPSLSP